ncbi:MAG: hypothetical protein FWH41_10425 [Treponema sp.]|nr:hypothetical protein [Treponema sp.]
MERAKPDKLLVQIVDKEDKDEIFRLQMLKTEQAKEQIATEKAERLKIENDIRRGMYISRNELKSCSEKLMRFTLRYSRRLA